MVQGSVTNHIMGLAVIGQPEPTVGMGATLLLYTDRHAATVTKVETIKGTVYITVQEDTVKRADKNGMSESQTWDCTPNPNGATSTFRRTPEGFWDAVRYNAQTKRWNKVEGNKLRIGARDHYHDFSF